jgi:hypothetical protein
MLLIWALVFWGTLLAGTAALEAFGEGGRSVWGRLWPESGASLWAWINAGSIVLAVIAWSSLAAFVLWFRRRREEASAAD